MAAPKIGLVPQIILGVIVGTIVALVAPELAITLGILGQLFVAMLKAVAPMLVLVLVMTAVATQSWDAQDSGRIALTLGLYLCGTIAAAAVAVLMSAAFPQTIALASVAEGAPPDAVGEVLRTVLFKLVDNPIRALVDANFLGCLTWAILLGTGFRKASDSFKDGLRTISEAITGIVRLVIRLAPVGIFGLVAQTVATVGIDALADYASLTGVLVASMLVVALLVNPLLLGLLTGRNPYPVVFQCLQESGITAFFTRSSAANIPVNLALAQRLGIREELYSVTIPIGATVNMAGAAITISTLALAAASTLGVEVSIGQALVLCVVSALAACGASGVPSGSLLLVPLACGLFGIPIDTAMQVVAVGFIISVVQDSAETALNSSTDVVYSYAADRARWGVEASQAEQALGER
ncbi:MAG: serine/threonine transporter SstT [Pseudomonadota bacterium]